MLRLPLLATLFWLLLGSSIGWWLHSLYNPYKPEVATVGRTILPAPGRYTPTADTDPMQSYREILSTEQTQKPLTRSERDGLTREAKKLLEENEIQAQEMLDSWMEYDPSDPTPLFLLAQAHLEAGRYQQALSIALDLYAYPQDEISLEEVEILIDNIETQYGADLHKRQQFEQLITLYQEIISFIPGKNKTIYRLAEVYVELGQIERAMDQLNQILFDDVWGERAQKLASRIQLNLQLKDQTPIPLENANNQFIVSATINGIPDIRLLIDTGASICVLRPQTALNLGLLIDEENDLTVNLPAGVVNTPTTQMDFMEIGEARLDNVTASIIEMPPGIEADGLLGMNFLGYFRFFIDQEKATLHLSTQ